MSHFETEFDRYYAEALDLLQRNRSTVEVYDYIRAIEDDDYRNRTFGRLAQHLASRGDLGEALRYCSAIEKPLEHADALFEVGRVVSREHSLSDAKNVFADVVALTEAMERNDDKSAILLQVADQIARLGSADEALGLVYRAVDVAKPIPQNFEASKTLRGCARILAQWNRQSEAVKVAESIDGRWSELRETTLEEIKGRGQWPVQPDKKG